MHADPVLTFRDRSPLAGHQSFIIYEVNAGNTTPLGMFNTTTDQVTLKNNVSYILQFTTTNGDYFVDPMLIPVDFWNYMKGTYNGWILIGFLFVLFALGAAIVLR